MKILAIETSCDETALALIEASGGLKSPKFKVIKSLVASQIKIHAPFGGVVPNLAKREHLKNLPMLYQQVFGKEQTAKSKWQDIDLITVTVGPGLEPALWTGITFTEELAKKYNKPLIGANHLEGHLYSFLLTDQKKTTSSKIKNQKSKIFPAVALIVSGGHTILLLVKDLGTWKRLGETRDDAVGEAFDKVARILNLPYPGGPEIEKLATKGDASAINFPRPMMHQKNPVNPAKAGHGTSYDFSFSGLKTSVLYHVRDKRPATRDMADIAASFQQAAIDVLVAKTTRAAQEYEAKSVILSGGVAANKELRRQLRQASSVKGIQFFVPPFKYNTDNAVMIGIAGYFAHLRKKQYKLEAQGNLNI